ncbi:MMS19_N domain-containing protein [Cephalotus follicularis]|uniref:MMS19 nucleotide excision repair protein n=1 Tax=Cephalotus follicularis TaxID=3775 RepID=A0A1Q3AZV8_CEPFO|nr:MMS19_N domain-containing protein [Cephalotus follicularis]
MTEPSELTQHIESFVDSARSPAQQAASIHAIVSLVKKDVLTIETLVKEMGMYLTTTDNIIRARGILLLGEVLTQLASKPVDNATVHSLIGFFIDRLADWKALRGALVGCLALMRRKNSVGAVSRSDAKAVAQSLLQNLQVQSLGQHDRKLCFELLECLLESYPGAAALMGDDLVYGICEAIDGEKDPQCLILTFHIVYVLAQVHADPSGLLSSFAGDLFEILERYFPIHFTHPTGDDVDVKREDLSKALMLAFSSTPLFEPFVIPLLLEKLSSFLPSAKVDSLKYLSSCTINYGTERMEKHAGAIWSSLKDTIFTSHEPALPFASETQNARGVQENEMATEALTLLQKLIMQNNGSFVNLIINDEEINMIFNTINSCTSYNEIPPQSKQKLHAVGCILSVSAKASIASCNRVIESFFPRLMDALGLAVRNSHRDPSPIDNYVISKRHTGGALYLCIELLAACRDLIAGSSELASESILAHETCFSLLQNFSTPLVEAFKSTLADSSRETYNADTYFVVKGLQILSTFPGGYLLISKSILENILVTFVSIITVDFHKMLVWRSALKALVHIGSFTERCHNSEKTMSYMGIVVDKIVSLACVDSSNMPFPLILEAISEIGRSGRNYMLKIVQGIKEAVCANLSEVYAHGNLKSAETLVQLLECYSDKVLPWIHETGGFEELLLQFVVNIWDQIENCKAFSFQVHEKGLLDATMKAMKLTVGGCSRESQHIIVQKAYTVLSSSTIIPLNKSSTIPVQLEGLQITQEIDNTSSVDEWIHSLYASVITAVHPQTPIPNVRFTLHLFMTTLLKGSLPAAQALGSIVNKLSVELNGTKISSDCTLEDALDMICNQLGGGMINTNETALANLCRDAVNSRFLEIHAIVGLSWIGKGLLMRGHEKVKDITMIFLECLLSNGKMGTLPLKQCSPEISFEQEVHHSVMKCAADAFQILMGDSEVCLNRKFHAIIRPLYKQRFFSTIMPILQSLIMKTDSSLSRYMLYRAFAHIISETPLIVILDDAKKLIPLLLDGLHTLASDVLDRDILYSLLLVLSGILTNKNGQDAVLECPHIIINCLIELIFYPHKTLVRETAIQCLVAMSVLPHARIYPMRLQVLRAVSNALDDSKRAVRQEAVRCRQAWASTASRSHHV